MKTIAIIGANGQVGAEVSLFLSLRADVRVIPISRSFYGSTLLRYCGLECRYGSFLTAAEAQRLTEDCDLVADFSVPLGTSPEIRRAMRQNVTLAILHSASAQQYVYVSSHSLFRHSSKQARYRLYARAKKYAENLALRTGEKVKKEVYVLRLGQVHGVLQGVSREYLAGIRDEEAVLPDIPSLVVFAFSIAEALDNIAHGMEAPGTYTLVSVPAWTQTEVHEYYCSRAHITPRIRIEPVRPLTSMTAIRNTISAMGKPLAQAALTERELIDDALSSYAPKLARRLRAKHYVNRARAEIAMREMFAWRPIQQDFDAPGTRMRSLSDSRTTMHGATREVENLISMARINALAAGKVSAAPSNMPEYKI